jgi:multisubunit Na+/H+ antiporter MnhC subunit
LNMAFLMLAAITISIALIAAILVIRILLRRKHREEGLYGDQ